MDDARHLGPRAAPYLALHHGELQQPEAGIDVEVELAARALRPGARL
jgi:hypothetical protein